MAWSCANGEYQTRFRSSEASEPPADVLGVLEACCGMELEDYGVDVRKSRCSWYMQEQYIDKGRRLEKNGARDEVEGSF